MKNLKIFVSAQLYKKKGITYRTSIRYLDSHLDQVWFGEGVGGGGGGEGDSVSTLKVYNFFKYFSKRFKTL